MFRPASRTRKRLRIALMGPSSSGKTYSALALATGLGGRIALIDTEHGSASAYAPDPFTFDTLELATFDPRLYVEAIQSAEKEGYDVIIIDSLSHAWTGRGGALELVDKFTSRSKSKNQFTEGWSQVTPLQNQLIDAILSSPAHIIATMRTKVEYVTENDPRTGKMAPRKVGLAPVQREGMDYEFDIVGEMDNDHNLIVSKTRWSKIDGEVFRKPGVELGRAFVGWLNDAPESRAEANPGAAGPQPTGPPKGGAVVSSSSPTATTPHVAGLITPDMAAELHGLIKLAGMSDFKVREALAKRGVSVVERLNLEDAQAMIHKLRSHVEGATAADQLVERIRGAGPEEAAVAAGARLPAGDAAVAPVVDGPADPPVTLDAPDDSPEPPSEGAVIPAPAPGPYSPLPTTDLDSSDDYIIANPPRREARDATPSPAPRGQSRKGKSAPAEPAATPSASL